MSLRQSFIVHAPGIFAISSTAVMGNLVRSDFFTPRWMASCLAFRAFTVNLIISSLEA